MLIQSLSSVRSFTHSSSTITEYFEDFSNLLQEGTVWKEGTFFEENNVPLFNVGQIGAQNPKTILMIFVILYEMMEGNSVQFQPLSNKIFVFNKFWEMSFQKLESLHQFKTCNNIENY